MKILTLTMNPTVDKNTSADIVLPTKKTRCHESKNEPGGGGINVSRALKNLGIDSTALFLAGGSTGEKLQSLLQEEGISSRVVETSGETRENIIIHDKAINQLYRFGMPGPLVKEEEWKKMLLQLENLQAPPDFIIASGSIPPGVPDDFYTKAAGIARQKGSKYVLDTSGTALKKAAGNNVYLVKPNLNELAAIMGVKEVTAMKQEEYAEEAIKQGQAEIIVVSMGPRGAMLADINQIAYYMPPTVKTVSAVGAGDSMVAGIIYGLVNDYPVSKAVQYGVAAGTAATITPGTELCRKEDVEKIFEWMSDKVMMES